MRNDSPTGGHGPGRRGCHRFVWTALLCLAVLPATAGGDLRIDASPLDALPPNAVRHPSVTVLPDGTGMTFADGGMTVPTADHLAPGAGLVDVRFRAPAHDAGQDGRCTLVHMEAAPSFRLLLYLRRGRLALHCKSESGAGEWINVRETRRWEEGSRHRVRLAWRRWASDRWLVMLFVDGGLRGTALIAHPDTWSETCTLGARGDREPFAGVIEHIALAATAVEAPELQGGTRTIRVDAGQTVGECYAFWRVGNATKPFAFVEPRFFDRFRAGKPFCSEVSCIYLMGGRYPDRDPMYRGTINGRVLTDFTSLRAQLRAVVDAGYTPRIVLDNVPYTMSDPPAEHKYGNTAPPGDEDVWTAYVRGAVRAMIEEFGRETVRRWWFRVSTEPDLHPNHWAGTKAQWLAHFDHTVAAVKAELPEARVEPGNILNPAGSVHGDGRLWGLEIIDHAATGRNAVTGEPGTRMDAFGCSWYTGVGRSLDGFDRAVAAMRERLARYPRFADLPLHVGEHLVLHDQAGRRLWAGEATEWSAGFYAAFAERVYALDVDVVHEWSHATDGVLHAKGHVIAMLDRMAGGRRLAVTVDAADDSAARCGAIAAARDGRLFILLYNHRPWRLPRVAETVRLEVSDPRMADTPGWTLSEWIVDATRGVWAYAYFADCAAAGIEPRERAGRYEASPHWAHGPKGFQLFRRNRETYLALSRPGPTREAEVVAVRDGAVTLDLVMTGHSVRLLELAPRAAGGAPGRE
ncbi:MAG: GH39 family glycosyl hydrolase [Planctomycetota bacterium]